MAKTLKVLENLHEQQKKERERIYQLHQKNLQKLNESLQELYKSRLSEIEKNINRRIEGEWKEQIEEWNKTTKIALYTISGMMLILLIAGIAAGITIYLQRSEIEEINNKMLEEIRSKEEIYKNNYILNKQQEWEYKTSEKHEGYIRPRKGE